MFKKAHHGEDSFFAIGKDFSNLDNFDKIVTADIMDAWFNPSPKVLDKIKKYLPYTIRVSPPMYSEGLIETISKYRKIPKQNILAMAGSSAIIYSLFQNILKKGDNALILDPTYSEYVHVLKNLAQVNIIKHLLNKEDNFVINYEKLLKDVKRHNPKIICVVNPNSPTGQMWDKTKVKKFLKNIPKKTYFVIDETYLEYVDKKESLEKEVTNHKNLIIIKSMSKVYALSGARVGYLVANSNIIKRIFTFVPPFAVSLVAQIAAVEALKDEKYYSEKYKETHILREEIVRELSSISSIKVYDSVFNLILIELKGKIKAKELTSKLKEKNIFIRNCNTISSRLGNNFIRISVRDRNANRRMINEIKKILK